MQEMPVEQFVRHLRDTMDNESRFAFFLGAGCSISSGIPGAGELVNEWLGRLCRQQTGDNSGTGSKFES